MRVPDEAGPLVELVERLVRSALVPYEVVVDTAVEWLDQADLHPWVGGSQDRTAESLVLGAVARQLADELSWGEGPTDVDRLLAAFASLETTGFCVLEDIGPDPNGGREEARDALLRQRGAAAVHGFVFYSLVDLERALDEGVLTLSCGGWGFTPEAVARIALVACLAEHGFPVEDPGEGGRVVLRLTWRRRGWVNGGLGP